MQQTGTRFVPIDISGRSIACNAIVFIPEYHALSSSYDQTLRRSGVSPKLSFRVFEREQIEFEPSESGFGNFGFQKIELTRSVARIGAEKFVLSSDVAFG